MKLKLVSLYFYSILLMACGGGGDNNGGGTQNQPVPLNVNFNGLVSGTSTMIICNTPGSDGLCAAPNETVDLYRVNYLGQIQGAAIASVMTNDETAPSPGLYNINLSTGAGSSDYLLQVNLNGTIMRRLGGSGPVSPAIEFATQLILANLASKGLNYNIAEFFALDELGEIYNFAYTSAFTVDVTGMTLAEAITAMDAAFGTPLRNTVNFYGNSQTNVNGGGWTGKSTTGTNNCGDQTGVESTFANAMSVSTTFNTTTGATDSITVSYTDPTLGLVTYNGTVTGSQVEINSGDLLTFAEDGGTTTQTRISLSITSSDRLTGLETWSWTNGVETCYGVDSFDITR